MNPYSFRDRINANPVGFTCTGCGHLDTSHNNYGVCFVGRLASMPGKECGCLEYNPINIWMNLLWQEFEQHESLET